MWALKETRRLANNWNVDCFFRITHNDIVQCLAQLNSLKLTDHTIEIEKGGLPVHVQVCANMRAKLVSEIKINIKKLKEAPAECVDCLANVTRTISLANLKMIFPENRFWRQNNSEMPAEPCGYVEKYLGKLNI